MATSTSAKDFVELKRALRIKLIRCSSHKAVKQYQEKSKVFGNNDNKQFSLTSKHAYSWVPNKRPPPAYQFSVSVYIQSN